MVVSPQMATIQAEVHPMSALVHTNWPFPISAAPELIILALEMCGK
jgi:hypothetical protein